MISVNVNNKCSGSIVASANGFDVIECANCGFKHVYPLPTDEQIERNYRHEYYSKEKPLYIERYIEDLEWWNIVYERRYQNFEKYLSLSARKILDIGAGPGFFLSKGVERGWTAKGVEPNIKAASHCRDRGLNVENIFFNENTATDLGSFDVINMGEVLEHIPNPRDFLRLVHNSLNADGLICVVVPNDFNFFQNILYSHLNYPAWWVAPPHHINYFNFSSLNKLLTSVGYEVIHQESTFPIDIFLLMGEDYVKNDDLGRNCHKYRMNFEKAMHVAGEMDMLSSIYQAFAEKGLGREIVMYARAIV